jgi:L-iditol 2-dehydrogenase
MQAAFIHGPRDMRLGELPEPKPGAGRVLVDVEAVGICGSDLHYFKEGGIGSLQQIRQPFVPGHEFAGRLVEPLPEHDLPAGTLVAVDPARPCRHCEWCEAGYPNLCPRVVFTGAPPHQGALTRRIATTAGQIVPIPDSLTAEDAAMLEPLGVCIHAVDLAEPRYWESVCVLGCGPIGLGIMDLLRLTGVERRYAVDPQDYRRRMAMRMGAHEIAERHDRIVDLTGGRGVDLVIEATDSPEGFQHAAETVRIGGRLVLVGIPDGDGYRLEAGLARRKGLTVRWSRRMGETYPRAVRLAAEGRVDLRSMITHRVDLAGVPDAYAMLAAGSDEAVKVMVRL